MNEFDFQLAWAEIEQAKLVKDLEELVRKHLPSGYVYRDTGNADNSKAYLYKYRLASFALHRFKNKSNKQLPDFIYDKLRSLGHYYKNLLKHINTFEEYNEVFKYTPQAVPIDVMDNTGEEVVTKLALLIADNPHTKPVFADFTRSHHYTRAYHSYSKHNTVKELCIFETVRRKLTAINPIQYTYLNERIDELYKQTIELPPNLDDIDHIQLSMRTIEANLAK